MAGLTRTVHPTSNVLWRPIKQAAPDLQLAMRPQPGANGAAGEELMSLTFIDPDGEAHIYVFTEEGRQNLLRQLTGGIVLPGRGDIPAESG